MEKLGTIYDSLEMILEKGEVNSAEEEIKRECQILWETLCEADPQENMFAEGSYKKFMVGCICKLKGR